MSPDNRQSCLNALVMKAQQNLANQQQPLRPVGSSCGTVSPDSLQACLNTFALKLQRLDNSGAPESMCVEGDQSCINTFIMGLQQHAGLLGGCAGVAPEYKQACINNYVLSLQQQGVGAQPIQTTVSAVSTTAVASTTSTAVTVTTSGQP